MDVSLTALLKRVLIFSDLEDADLLDLARNCQKRKFRAGEAIFHEGDPGHTLYIICAGRVNVQIETGDGETVHIAHRGPGEHFGEMALIDGKPRMADVVTAEPTELLSLHRDAFIGCIEKRPKIALRVMAALADRLREAADHFGNFQELDVLGRVSKALWERLKTGAAPEPGGGFRLNAKVTQQQLAAEVAATRESVNRALANLKETGVLCPNTRDIVILDEKRLRQIFSFR